MKTIEFDDKGPSEIPDWAIRQRHLIDTMNQAAPIYQKRYTNDDGTFVWRENWPGMDVCATTRLNNGEIFVTLSMFSFHVLNWITGTFVHCRDLSFTISKLF